MDSDDVPFAFTYSEEFNVSIGDAFQLRLKSPTDPPPSYGGEPFPIQPLLAVTDRGGNVASSASGYSVTAALVSQPHASTVLYPLEMLTQTIQSGYAQFRGLTLNETGYSYKLRFTTDMVIFSI